VKFIVNENELSDFVHVLKNDFNIGFTEIGNLFDVTKGAISHWHLGIKFPRDNTLSKVNCLYNSYLYTIINYKKLSKLKQKIIMLYFYLLLTEESEWFFQKNSQIIKDFKKTRKDFEKVVVKSKLKNALSKIDDSDLLRMVNKIISEY